MAEMKRWPWALNQPGFLYPAEYLRGQHFDATGGGTGVGSPTALKVEAQTAPNGTVRIRPGGGTAATVYPGQENQSYQATNFQSENLTLEPVGSSSSGRHDLIIQRFLDPDHEDHPEATYDEDGKLTAEVAATLDFWWFEVYQGRSSTTQFDFPHVKLAHVRRDKNTTIVTNDDIVDLRKLAKPETWLHMRAHNLAAAETQSLHSGSVVWPTESAHTMMIPEWATRVHFQGTWASVIAKKNSRSSGKVRMALVHDDGSEIITQYSRFISRETEQPWDTYNIVLADDRPVPKKFRGQAVRVEMRGTKDSGPVVHLDYSSSWSIQLYFEQGIV